MECIENRTFDEIQLGDTASAVRTLSERDIELFAVLSGGDLHTVGPGEAMYATEEMLQEVLAPSLWSSALISWMVGTRLPGPGSVYRGQNLRFHRAMKVGDFLKVVVTVTAKDADDHGVTLDCICLNERGERVVSGTAWVIAPLEKVCSPPAELPIVHFHERGARHKKLVEMTSHLEPIATAVVHPVDTVSLEGAIRAAEASLIRPLLVGPEAKIRGAAEEAGIDLGGYEIISATRGKLCVKV